MSKSNLSATETTTLHATLPLVNRIAKGLIVSLPSSVAIDDLMQAGALGLLDAITRFDNTQGATFETYAYVRIRGAMMDELRGNDWLPRSMRKNRREIEVTRNSLQHRLFRTPTEAELAAGLNLPLAEYYELRADGGDQTMVYYEDFSDAEGSSNFLDTYCTTYIEDPLSVLLEKSETDSVSTAILELSEREQKIVNYYYNENITLKEIGVILGVTESRVCQIRSEALKKMRAQLA